jgi:hypothetical protein
MRVTLSAIMPTAKPQQLVKPQFVKQASYGTAGQAPGIAIWLSKAIKKFYYLFSVKLW